MDSQYKTIHPVKYLEDHFTQGIRPDGRDFLAFRPISINISSIQHADGSAIFKIGNTTVVCGIKAELATPTTETPEHGYIIPNVELSPMCSPKFRPGPPSDQAQVISKLIENILISSRAVNLNDLCISKGKLVWVLYCDLLCVNYDGSVIDACIGALTAALKSLTLPETIYNTETSVVTVQPETRIPFAMRSMPVSTTFAIFNDDTLVADPTDDEESLSLARLSIVMDDEKICCIHKPGGVPISRQMLGKSMAKSKARAKLVRSLMLAAASTIETE